MTDEHTSKEIKESDGRNSVSKNLPQELPKEINGPKGPEPTRYGDWEVKGRVSDF